MAYPANVQTAVNSAKTAIDNAFAAVETHRGTLTKDGSEGSSFGLGYSVRDDLVSHTKKAATTK